MSRGRDQIRARAKRDGIPYGEALNRMLAEAKTPAPDPAAVREWRARSSASRKRVLWKMREQRSYTGDWSPDAIEAWTAAVAILKSLAPKPATLVHLRLSAVMTSGPESYRGVPRCKPGYAGPVWDAGDPRLTDDRTEVTCRQCRRFDS